MRPPEKEAAPTSQAGAGLADAKTCLNNLDTGSFVNSELRDSTNTSDRNPTSASREYWFSLVQSVREKEPQIETVSLQKFMDKISSGRWADPIRRVRDALARGDTDAAKAEKLRLPAALPSGIFERRAIDGLRERSGLICADLDQLGDQLAGYREHIEADPYTFGCFLSPSGNGLKVLMLVDLGRTHEEAFRAMKHHFLKQFDLEIDEACKDVSRACFVSFDPDAYLGKGAQVLSYPPEPVSFATPDEKLPRARLVDGTRPGDDYDARGDFFGLLRKHGWTPVGDGNTRWTRPGKTNGVSATWNAVPDKFHVFSSNAAPLEAGTTYRPWHVFAILEHKGDFKAAAQALAAKGYGARLTRTVSTDRNFGDIRITPVQTTTLWPEPVAASHLLKQPPPRPPELISGMLYHGGTLLMAGASKSRKTYTMLQQGIAVATGGVWLGMECDLAPVLYLNLELQDFAVHDRLRSICDALRIKAPDNFHLWNLRGVKCSKTDLVKQVPDMIHKLGAKLVILDPYYKVSSQSGMDEISNHEQGELLCELETMCAGPGAALTIAHHFAKGNQSAKNAIDRASGGGVFARWPDAIMTMTDHKEENALIVEMALRNFAPKKPFVVRYEHPLWVQAPELRAGDLKDAAGRKRVYREEDTLAKLPPEGATYSEWARKAAISKTTFGRHLERLLDTGKVKQVGQVYNRR
jgi:hypothetical protein